MADLSGFEQGVAMYTEELRTDDDTSAGVAAEAELRKGLIWFGTAAAATAIAYAAAVDGQTFLVFWTVLMYAGYRLARGLYYRAHPETLARNRSVLETVD